MKQSTRSRKFKAILAGGAVLGVGAAVTLAAWSDDQAATGTFTTGTFALQSSTDGTNWANNGQSAPATLAFDAGTLAPSDTVAAPFGLQVTGDYSADVTMSTSGTALTGLTYDLYEVGDAAECTTGVAGDPVLTDSNLDTGTYNTTLDAGTPAFLCFVVTASADLAQGASASTTWTFDAESK
ncbi:SipW-dependent-type signal peptide-containing protein [Pseudactinotalea sp. HY158]|uniref:SipW-dependent-type signal peptide-containing protein n=1 Tax=Pseudactinotalea sp. HY158 TaxID=2654547 RepID=UPI00129CAB63|nr:SipW-dependent-type signal peptide-containing protein [Pseudactinotalea sp. HY158]QGH68628.1 hypothetical protein GCE65_03230 [Pseudactinotalea sp. HY158]